MSYLSIKLNSGKERQVEMVVNHYSTSETCRWCGKEIKQNKIVFKANKVWSESCCSMPHAKAFLNAKG